MATITLAPALTRWLPGQRPGSMLTETAEGDSVKVVLEQFFIRHPLARSYVVDELGQLRHHVIVFVNGVAVCDKQNLSTSVTSSSEIYIFQALSGG